MIMWMWHNSLKHFSLTQFIVTCDIINNRVTTEFGPVQNISDIIFSGMLEINKY